jgi:hypothetical protein
MTRVEERVVDVVTERIGRRRGLNRRSFLSRVAIVGSALAVNPLRWILKPGTAYAAACGTDAECNSGWTVMCCSINNGSNTCPPGTLAAGWWKADNSGFCRGSARYYIDCNSTCSCGCGSSGLCGPACWSCGCHCGSGTCDHRRVCCNQFRYGQCNQATACVGPVVCRVVTCVPPWQFDTNCSATSATANATALHDAPCLHQGSSRVFAFGGATFHGEPASHLNAAVVGMDATPTGNGYWIVAADGGVFAYGDARFHGSMGSVRLNKPVVDLARTPSGNGYWMVASDGGIFSFGDAKFRGSTGSIRLNQPVVGMASTPTGKGYWLVASDGGIFAFGDARFLGSMGSVRLKSPIVGIAATKSGKGYWMVAADGGIFAFGDAHFRGSLASFPLTSPITAIAPTPTGKGYWMLAQDGALFSFGDAKFFGALTGRGSQVGRSIDLAADPKDPGYWITTSS